MSKAASLILLLPWSVMFLTDVALVAAKDECYTNADCYNEFRHLRIACCKNSRDSDRICQPYNCEGRYCFTDGDCGGEGECCLDNKCIHSQECPRCNSTSDCATSEYCCKRAQGNVCRRNCVGERCDSNSECAGPEEYCDSANTCAKSPQTTTITSKDTSKEIPKHVPKETSTQTTTATQKSKLYESTNSLPGYAIAFIILFVIIIPIQCYLLYYRCKKPVPSTRRERENDAERVDRYPSYDIPAIHEQSVSQTAQQPASRPPPPTPSSQTRIYEYADDSRECAQGRREYAQGRHEYAQGRLINTQPRP